ncbi:MAG: DUF4386 domain-containing protein [Alphaproteobacteria bacterium]|nr:MAG: DUF4386 domain-containing protein [Alphaproteobacteria bacterium]
MTPTAIARTTGLFYLVIIICGICAEVTLSSNFLGLESPDLTAEYVLIWQRSFRLIILANLIMIIADGLVAVLLFQLLRPVNEALSLLAMVFRLLQTAALIANLDHLVSALHLGRLPRQIFSVDQIGALTEASLDSYGIGYDIALVFFAFSCFALGALIYRTSVMPKLLGALITLSGLVYLIGSLLTLLDVPLTERFALAYAICLVSEPAFALWLLIRGINPEAYLKHRRVHPAQAD